MVPAATPFTVHAYVGVAPPFVIDDVKVTEAPAQAGLAEAAIAILGAEGADTVMVIAFEVAGLPSTPLRFEVITQVTISPLASVLELYVVELVPTLTPFTFH